MQLKELIIKLKSQESCSGSNGDGATKSRNGLVDGYLRQRLLARQRLTLIIAATV